MVITLLLIPVAPASCRDRNARPDPRSLAKGGPGAGTAYPDFFLLRPFLFRRSLGPRLSATTSWGERREKEKKKRGSAGSMPGIRASVAFIGGMVIRVYTCIHDCAFHLCYQLVPIWVI
jgi:hypothetical protein